MNRETRTRWYNQKCSKCSPFALMHNSELFYMLWCVIYGPPCIITVQTQAYRGVGHCVMTFSSDPKNEKKLNQNLGFKAWLSLCNADPINGHCKTINLF